MSTGKIEVWISVEGDPCRISEIGVDNPHPWVVAVWDCCGRLLKWCGREYFNLPAECGHLDIEVPPGCYVLRAAEAMNLSSNGVWGNYWTDHAVVTVDCGEEVCVRLIAPSAHLCGWGWNHVLEALRRLGVVSAELINVAIEANRAVVERLPRSSFEFATMEDMIRLVTEAEKRKRQPPDPSNAG